MTALAIACAVAACGKKGPPLTPIVRVPAAVENLAVRRVGSDVYVSMTLPDQNIDGSAPAALARVDVYGATSLAVPPRTRFLEIATLLGSIPVARAADPENPGELLPPPDPASGALQGAAVTLRDALTDEARSPRELPPLSGARAPTPLTGVTVVPPVRVLRRFYMAIPVSTRDRPGPPSAIVELPLTPLPDPPASLRATLSDGTVTLHWEASGGLMGWLIDRGLAVEGPPYPVTPAVTAAPAAPSSDLPAGPTQYSVYRQLAPDPLAPPVAGAPPMAPPWTLTAPAAVTTTPLAALTWAEPVEPDERPRCYTVRAVRGDAALRVESDASEPVCLVPLDLTPPATPTGLAAIAAEGVINLLWEPNVELDLGGFLVLRRDGPGDTLLQLTPSPISETRFSDRNVTAGVRYTYEVRAVDTRLPLPNVSGPAAVSETAR